MAEIYLQLTYLTMVGELVAACESIYHVADSIYHNMDYAYNCLILRQLNNRIRIMINTNFAYNINKVICTFPKILQKRKKTSAYIWPNQYLFVPLWPNNDTL